MIGEALVAEHDVIATGHGNQEIHARGRKKHHQGVHVVLICFCVVGVTDITAHRQPQQLATEMVLKPRSDDLLAIVKIFRADEAHDRIDEKW